jgi:hypothetical protein
MSKIKILLIISSLYFNPIIRSFNKMRTNEYFLFYRTSHIILSFNLTISEMFNLIN